MINIINKTECYGCGSCAMSCPVKCISMKTDEEGFDYPEIDSSKCIECGKCDMVCPAKCVDSMSTLNVNSFDIPYTIGGWIKDETIRYDSSSGGVFSLVASFILDNDGIVYGATMDENLIVRHIEVSKKEDLKKLRGSKYVQSNLEDVYPRIQALLEQGRKVLFSGCPCQTAGLISFLGKFYDNLYSMDFICHGVPSPKVFAGYIEYLERLYSDRIIDFKFRLKDKRWHSSGLQMGTGFTTEKGKFVRKHPAFRDPFMNGFLDDIYLRPSCYECRFKKVPKYYSNITLADFWGLNKCCPELNDGMGTSLVLINDYKGKSLFEQLKKDMHYKEVNYYKAIASNKSLLKSAKYNSVRDKFFVNFNTLTFEQVRRRHLTSGLWWIHKVGKISRDIIEQIVIKAFRKIAGIVRIDISDEHIKSILQFLGFAMVGCTNVLVSYSVNICTLFLLRRVAPWINYDYVVANILAFLISVLWSFYWNSKKVFEIDKIKKPVYKLLLKSYISYAFSGIVLNNLLATLWIQVLGISKFISPLINVPITMFVNFFMLKNWAFSSKKKNSSIDKI